MELKLSILTVGAIAVAMVSGCFKEPVPAAKTVPEGARVYLSDRGLVEIGPSLASSDPAIVDYINLDRNQLASVDGIEKFTALKWLRLNGNNLQSLPDLSGLVKLRRIYLADNRFVEVPDALRNLEGLTDIDFSGNQIKSIPDWLAAKEGLQNLSFNRTSISKLPDDISAWKSLKSLQLGDLMLSLEEMKRIRTALPDTAIVF